jgi:hypothetical protein
MQQQSFSLPLAGMSVKKGVFPQKSLSDFVGISYDIINHVLSEHNAEGRVSMTLCHETSTLELSINSTQPASEAAVLALVKLGLVKEKHPQIIN